ncbi:amidohydrolase [Phycicoccus sp. Soil803]|uniref:amidohydrolase family protein n=1 Tax=Phycicoccus sp. Soil803 TaxID=1736415 RepID=UPI00070F24A7|nr:amidohydrolase family protein [Phycicoccus sp. Soil803]KRF26076.1 hypothetical protein ASG95_17585 [Phycicoccus sp. Soil803]
MTRDVLETVRIDSHHHTWEVQRRPQTWMTAEQDARIGHDQLLPDWAAAAVPCGVQGSVLVQTVRDPSETVEFLEVAARVPLVRGVVGWVDLDRGPGDVASQVQALTRLPGADRLVGVRDQSADRPEADWADGAAAAALFEACGAAGLVVDLLLRPDQWPAAARAVARHSQTRFVLDHFGNVDFAASSADRWQAGVGGFSSSPNVALKLSGVAARASDPEVVRRLLPRFVGAALDAFGRDRLMFGSDWPVSSMSMTYAEVVDTVEDALDRVPGASDDDRRAVWGATAVAWYALPD